MDGSLPRLFACDEIKKNACHESRYGGTDYEDNILCVSRNLVIGTNCTLLIHSAVSFVNMVLAGLVLASVVCMRPCCCLEFVLFPLELRICPNRMCFVICKMWALWSTSGETDYHDSLLNLGRSDEGPSVSALLHELVEIILDFRTEIAWDFGCLAGCYPQNNPK